MYKILSSNQAIEIHPDILDYPWDFCRDTRTAAVPKGLIQIAMENKEDSDIMLLYKNIASLCSFDLPSR